jgi:hypothetical protein
MGERARKTEMSAKKQKKTHCNTESLDQIFPEKELHAIFFFWEHINGIFVAVQEDQIGEMELE